jgi:hypothetical protein
MHHIRPLPSVMLYKPEIRLRPFVRQGDTEILVQSEFIFLSACCREHPSEPAARYSKWLPPAVTRAAG